jgi:hypothetical protein
MGFFDKGGAEKVITILTTCLKLKIVFGAFIDEASKGGRG